jgi:hypothetical protein
MLAGKVSSWVYLEVVPRSYVFSRRPRFTSPGQFQMSVTLYASASVRIVSTPINCIPAE